MPFGLCNTPAVFQQFVKDFLREVPMYKSIKGYLDYILSYSKDLKTYQLHVRSMLF